MRKDRTSVQGRQERLLEELCQETTNPTQQNHEGRKETALYDQGVEGKVQSYCPDQND